VAFHTQLQGIFSTQDGIHISCDFCIAGGFFTAEYQGSPKKQARRWEKAKTRF